MDIVWVLTGVQMPRINSIMKRWIQSCRHELLDRMLVYNQTHPSYGRYWTCRASLVIRLAIPHRAERAGDPDGRMMLGRAGALT